MSSMARKATTARTSKINRATPDTPSGIERYCRGLEDWPRSWMGWEKDLPPGEQLVARFRPFLEYLVCSGLAPKTLQKHVDNLWALGGEIIRDLNEDPTLRRKTVAQHADRWGFTRFWLAEHHNMPGIASAATSVLIGHVAGKTSTIRVGSGGVMLPNHSPLVIAEQFGTLDALYPGRIDLGVGRAPGSDRLTSQALRFNATEDAFPQQVNELLAYLGPQTTGRQIMAYPGVESNVPVWLLGSSTYSAELAAELSLPFAFASHFAPALLFEAIDAYGSRFKPSVYLDKPYVAAGIPLVV